MAAVLPPSTTSPARSAAGSATSFSAASEHDDKVDDANNRNNDIDKQDGPAAAAAAASSSSPSQQNNAAAPSAEKRTPAAAPPPPPPPPPPVRTVESFGRLMVERYTMRDSIAAAALSQQLNQTMSSSHETREKINEYRSIRTNYAQWFPPSRLYGEGYAGHGNGFTENHGPSRIVYPSQKPRPGRRSTPALKYSRRDMLKQAEQHEELVPVRLDVEWDRIKLRDTFTWNLHERVLAVELFAAQLVEDMGLKMPASQPVFDQVVQQMREQLNDFYPFAFYEEDALDPELPYAAYKNDEMRVLIKLNITIGQHTLVDQFEWEINNPANSPEDFAAAMARDLSLSGEFTTAIAHCIREQSQLFTKSLYSVGHPFDGRPVEDSDLVSAFLQTPLPTVFRPQQQAKEYAPYMYEMSEADLERNETSFSRDQRRQKRSINRRGGPQLPDLKDRQRTIRTLIVSSVLPGAALDINESRLFKKAANVPGTNSNKKRAARGDGDASDSEDSDDSGAGLGIAAADSPAPSHITGGLGGISGTARTRNMRGAATAAQQRMANLGRSETPEHFHETRTSARRFREETEDAPSLWVSLKVTREKLRKIMRGDYRGLSLGPSQPGTPLSQPSTRAQTSSLPPKAKPPAGAGSVAVAPPPAPTLASNNSSSSSSSSSSASVPPAAASLPSSNVPPGQIGRLPAPPLVPGQSPPPAPPPPEWLVAALKDLEKLYPHGDKFEAIMKYSYLDPVNELPTQVHPMPEGVKYAWLPRIRCLDCTTKLYTPGPDMTAQKFEAHLKFTNHKDKVKARLAAEAAAAASASASS